jgi:hypothetical protein
VALPADTWNGVELILQLVGYKEYV